MTQVPFARGDQQLDAPVHFALIHYGEEELRAGVLNFLEPALNDPNQGIYLCGPEGEASRFLDYLASSAGRDVRADVPADGRVLDP